MNLRMGFDPYTMAFGMLTSGAGQMFGLPGGAKTTSGGTSMPSNMTQTQEQSTTQVQSNAQTVAIGSNLGGGAAPSALDALSNMGLTGLPQSYALPTLNLSSQAATPWGTYALIGGGVLLAVYFLTQKK